MIVNNNLPPLRGAGREPAGAPGGLPLCPGQECDMSCLWGAGRLHYCECFLAVIFILVIQFVTYAYSFI